MLGWYPPMLRSFLGPRKSWELVERGEVKKGSVLPRASREAEREGN